MADKCTTCGNTPVNKQGLCEICFYVSDKKSGKPDNKSYVTPAKEASKEKQTYIERIEANVSPIFTPEAGDRFRLIRMTMLIDQAEMGELLGLSQQQISFLERGRIEHPPFTLALLRATVGEYWTFILFGTGRGQELDARGGFVKQKYWHTRLKIRRKPGSGAHRIGAKGSNKG